MTHVLYAPAGGRQTPARSRPAPSRAVEYTYQIVYAAWFLFMMVIAPKRCSGIEVLFVVAAWIAYAVPAFLVRQYFATMRIEDKQIQEDCI